MAAPVDTRRVFRGPLRACAVLILANLLWHGSLLAWVHFEESWIEFRGWYRMLACYAPVMLTVVLGLLAFHYRLCGGVRATAAVAISVLMAIMHALLLDLAAAIVQNAVEGPRYYAEWTGWKVEGR